MSLKELIIHSSRAVGEIPDPANPRPLRGFPEGEVRLRLRQGDFAQAFVRVPGGIRRFLVHEKDGHWQPFMEMAANLTAVQPAETRIRVLGARQLTTMLDDA